MPIIRFLALAVCLAALQTPVWAAEPMSCLGREQRRTLLASGQVIALKEALAMLSGRPSETLLKASLCKSPKGYVYLLTLLARDGKVARVVVDAKNGVVVTR